MKVKDKKQIIEFVNSTLNFFECDPSNRRSKNDWGEKFYSRDGKSCAIGMHLKPGESLPEGRYVKTVFQDFGSEIFWQKFQEQACGIPIGVLCGLQAIHDCDDCWFEMGFTMRGEDAKEKLLKYVEQEKFMEEDCVV